MPQQQTINLASQFADLTNSILKETDTQDVINDLKGNWIKAMQESVMSDLKAFYHDLLVFKDHRSSIMSKALLSKSYTIKTPEVDPRLLGYHLDRAVADFVQELGFQISEHPKAHTTCGPFFLSVYIDTAKSDTRMRFFK